MSPFTRGRCALALVVSVGSVLGVTVLGVTVAAQAVRRSQTPLQQATRALLEGRYDEVEALANQLGQNDPAAVALKARALIARGRYADAEALLRTVATRAAVERRGAGARAARQDAGARRRQRHPQPGGRAVAGSARRGACAARARRVQGGERHVPQRGVAGAEGSRREHASGASSTSTPTRTPMRSNCSQIALEADPTWTPALLGAAMSLADDDPPQAVAAAKKALEINPSYVEAHVFLAHQALDQDHKDEAREALQKALAVNPNSLEAHSALAALAYVEDKKSDFEAEVAKVLAIAPANSEVYRVVGELTAHNYRFDEAVDAAAPGRRAAAAGCAVALRSRRAPVSHRRRARRAAVARSRVQARSVLQADLQHARPAGHARQVRHRPRRRSDFQVPEGRGRAAAGVRDSAGASGARTASRRATSSRRRDRSSSSSSPSTTTSP